MTTAINVAKFFLSKVDRDNGDVITHLKLQKLVYYSLVWSWVLYGKKLFEERIEAWVHGPVCPKVWNEYRQYDKKTPIPEPEGFSEGVFFEDELELLNLINSTYGDLTASKLWRLCHTEHPWLEARRGIPKDKTSQEVILLEWIQEYYSNFVDIRDNSIHPEVFSEEKDLDSLVILNDGEREVQVETTNLYQYLKSTSEKKDNKKIRINVKRPKINSNPT